jgi:hypothetical protein
LNVLSSFEESMKSSVILAIVLLSGFRMMAQADQPCSSCLPEGITFTTQAQIDSFRVNYPGCTVIEGDVIIDDSINDHIYNLNGLSVLSSISGSLRIENNHYLNDLTGLSGIAFIEGDLCLGQNHSVTNLTGFEGLHTIGGKVYIYVMYNLMNLNGLDNLYSIGEDLYITQNEIITSLNGLEEVTSIEGDLMIWMDDALTDLTGLYGLISIGGSIGIYDNDHLDNLSGLESLTNIPGNLEIGNDIYHGNPSLTSLTGLQGLISIGGNLVIVSNRDLLGLTGLEGLNSIGGDLGLWNNSALPNFTGLEGLGSVGGDLLIGTLQAGGNHSLTDFTGLDGLTSIGGDLFIFGNALLTSLNGLDNIEASSISNLSIFFNPNLSSCAVKSICDYLVSPTGTIVIHTNSSGCNNPEEVDSACVYLSNEEVNFQPKFSIYPNPASTAITVFLPSFTPFINSTLTIFNINSQLVLSHQITEPQTTVNISNLPSGIYFVRIVSERTVLTEKFMKQ